MLDSFNVDSAVFLHVLISLVMGALVGLERQSQQSREGRERNGVRTFALAGLLGTVSAIVSEIGLAFALVAAVGFFALIVVHYVVDSRERGRALGITTETAAFVVFALGALVPTRPLLAVSIAVLVTLLLSQKKFIHKSVRQLTREEVYATIKLLLVSVVLLPLLPSEPVDPWGIYQPQKIWLLVVLISAISFVGYFAMRWLGSRRGIALTGILGGLASSTAVTLAMAARARESAADAVKNAAAFAIVSANAIMFVRVMIEVAVVSPGLLPSTLGVIGAVLAGAIIGATGLWFWGRVPSTVEPVGEGNSGEADSDSESEEADESATDGSEDRREPRESAEELLENPFQLGPALKFGAVFVAIIGLTHVAQEAYGDRGIFIAALVGGLADSDATVLTAAKLFESDSIGATSAVRAILLAVLSNSIVKAGLAGFLGSARLGGRVLVGLTPVFVAAVIAWFFLT